RVRRRACRPVPHGRPVQRRRPSLCARARQRPALQRQRKGAVRRGQCQLPPGQGRRHRGAPHGHDAPRAVPERRRSGSGRPRRGRRQAGGCHQGGVERRGQAARARGRGRGRRQEEADARRGGDEFDAAGPRGRARPGGGARGGAGARRADPPPEK
ncbi:unnamed protein product, partial [Prorocentrum cordatum]